MNAEIPVNLSIDFDGITEMLSTAHQEERGFLYEYEVYALLARSGSETPPQTLFIPRGAKPSDEALMALPGAKSVLKIVSPTIIHKTEVGGVRIVEKDCNRIRSAIRRMLYEVPENYTNWIQKNPDAAPEKYKECFGEALTAAISRDIKGVLQVQFMPPDSEAFGNELIVGLRNTREFGTVISAGLGGTDTELYAARFRKGQAIVAASCAMNDGHAFFQLFKKTISYRKLTGLTRGQRRIVTDEQLIECFESFIAMGNHYSQFNPKAPFVIEELEINPFAFTDYLMVPLDGMCRFSKPDAVKRSRPVGKIESLLHPETIGIIGVSSKRKNFGRIILDNILAEGYPKEKIVIIREDEAEIDGIPCVSNLTELTQSQSQVQGKSNSEDENQGQPNSTTILDLFIVAVGAAQVPELVEEVISRNVAKSVMLIPGGMGETQESKVRADQVIARIDEVHGTLDGGPVFLGANCMGVVSRPGGYDTWFIPEAKYPKKRHAKVHESVGSQETHHLAPKNDTLKSDFHRAALISQSGAFMLHRSSQCPELNPAYMISMGNQTDLTLGDMIHYFKDSDEVDVIAVYAEGFNDLDGLSFCQAVREAILNGKEVIFYKAGRTPEGKAATSGHTASLAGDYMVCENCVRQAGAIVARNFTEFQQLFMLAENLSGKRVNGNRLAALSGAGFEAVGMADAIRSDDFQMSLATFSEDTCTEIREILIEKRLDAFVTLSNPLDINPSADDDAHYRIAKTLIRDPNVDAVIVSLDPMSPVTRTLATLDLKSTALDDRNIDRNMSENPEETRYDMEHESGCKHLMIRLMEVSEKPIVAVVDGGRLYDPLRDALMGNGVPVFTVCDNAVAALSLYIQGRLAALACRQLPYPVRLDHPKSDTNERASCRKKANPFC